MFVISFAEPVHASFADTLKEAPTARVDVACRRLRDPGHGLHKLLTAHDSPGGPAVAASTEPAADAWPLWSDPEGGLTDLMGGEVALVRGGRLSIGSARQPRSVAVAWVAGLAAELELELREGAVTRAELEEADEALLIGFPHCVLPIASLDGRELGGGPLARMLLDAWSARAGVDIGAQTAAMLRGEKLRIAGG